MSFSLRGGRGKDGHRGYGRQDARIELHELGILSKGRTNSCHISSTAPHGREVKHASVHGTDLPDHSFNHRSSCIQPNLNIEATALMTGRLSPRNGSSP